MSDSAKTTSGDLFGVKIHRVLGEVETLLNDGGQFADATAFFAQNVLGAGCHDDDFGLGGSDTDLDARVTIFGQFTSQKLVQFGFENAVSDELKSNKGWIISVFKVWSGE